MEFNNASNQEKSLIHDVYFWSGTDSTSFPIADITRSMNEWLRKVATWIWQAAGNWEFDDSNQTNFPIATTDLNADQTNYSLPTSIMQIYRIDVKNSGGDWIKLKPIDQSGIDVALDEYNGGSSGEPEYYDIRYNSIFIYPFSSYTSTDGMKVYFSRDIHEFLVGDTDAEPGFPAIFHRLLSLGASKDYAVANEFPIEKIRLLASRTEAMRKDLVEFFSTRNSEYETKVRSNIQDYK